MSDQQTELLNFFQKLNQGMLSDPQETVSEGAAQVLGAIMKYLAPAATEAYDDIQGAEFAVPGTEYTNQDLYGAIAEGKEQVRNWAEKIKAEEFASEDKDYNWFKDFMVETGADIADLLPGGNLGFAVEGLDWGTGGLGNLLPLLGLLPAGGVRKALLRKLDDEIDVMSRVFREASEAGQLDAFHFVDSEGTGWQLPVLKERLDKFTADRAAIADYSPRIFEKVESEPSADFIGSKKSTGWNFPRNDLEDYLFHITTEGQGLDIDPMLYGLSSGDISGLTGAGGAGTRGVSFLSEPEDAIRLMKELRRIKRGQNTVETSDDFVAYLEKLGRQDIDEYGGSFVQSAQNDATREFINKLRLNQEEGVEDPVGKAVASGLAVYRDRRGGDPLIFANQLHDSQIRMLAVDRDAIPKDAHIRVHYDPAGREVRVASDVPVDLERSREILRSIGLRDVVKTPLDKEWESAADVLAIESLNRAIKDGSMTPEMTKLHKMLATKSGRIFGLDKKGGYYNALKELASGWNGRPQKIETLAAMLQQNPKATLSQVIDDFRSSGPMFEAIVEKKSADNLKNTLAKILDDDYGAGDYPTYSFGDKNSSHLEVDVEGSKYHIPYGGNPGQVKMDFVDLAFAEKLEAMKVALDEAIPLKKAIKKVKGESLLTSDEIIPVSEMLPFGLDTHAKAIKVSEGVGTTYIPYESDEVVARFYGLTPKQQNEVLKEALYSDMTLETAMKAKGHAPKVSVMKKYLDPDNPYAYDVPDEVPILDADDALPSEDLEIEAILKQAGVQFPDEAPTPKAKPKARATTPPGAKGNYTFPSSQAAQATYKRLGAGEVKYVDDLVASGKFKTLDDALESAAKDNARLAGEFEAAKSKYSTTLPPGAKGSYDIPGSKSAQETYKKLGAMEVKYVDELKKTGQFKSLDEIMDYAANENPRLRGTYDLMKQKYPKPGTKHPVAFTVKPHDPHLRSFDVHGSIGAQHLYDQADPVTKERAMELIQTGGNGILDLDGAWKALAKEEPELQFYLDSFGIE